MSMLSSLLSRRHVRNVAGACCVGSAGWLLAAAAVAASPNLATAKPTVIAVVAGKPSEFRFELSTFSSLPAGAFTFRVKNEGASSHDFELCAAPVSNVSQNLCVGYESQDLLPGQTTKITISHIGKGRYEFLSTDAGDASAGMKGLIGVGIAVAQPRLHLPAPRVPTPAIAGPIPSPTVAATTTAPTTTNVAATTPTDTTSAAFLIPELG